MTRKSECVVPMETWCELLNLDELIALYWQLLQLEILTVWEALAFANTELGEVYEELLAKAADKWKRNNPEDHPQEFDIDRFAGELGDVILMCIVAGRAESVNVLAALRAKLTQKIMVMGTENADVSN